MIIVADANVPYAAEAFASYGEVHLWEGRRIDRDVVRTADVLIVRSVTQIDKQLLAGSLVKFVGTATTGTDHVDTAYLAAQGIGFAAAPGSNANSVAEYVIALLLEKARDAGQPLAGRRLGVVGVGNVGRLVCAKAEALGMITVKNDPPRQELGESGFVPLVEVLDCEAVTLHVPLTDCGPWPTRGLADEEFFRRLRRGALFINTSRGEVVEEAALRRALDTEQCAAALDVWRNEPRLDPELLQKVWRGTPHIAGYSFDGKVKGTQLIYNACGEYFGWPRRWQSQTALQSEIETMTIESRGCDNEEIARRAVLAVYNPAEDHHALAAVLRKPEQAGEYFDALRKGYRRRREFHIFYPKLSERNKSAAAMLVALGFRDAP